MFDDYDQFDTADRFRDGLAETDDLDELADYMETDSGREAYEQADEILDELFEQEKEPFYPHDVPSYEVTVDDTDYRIHPIVHGRRAWMRLDNGVKRRFRDAIDDYLDRGDGVHVEEGDMDRAFFDGLATEKMDDLRWAKQEHRLQKASYEAKKLPLFAVGIPLYAKDRLKGTTERWETDALDDLAGLYEEAEKTHFKKPLQQHEQEYLAEDPLLPELAVMGPERSKRQADYLVHEGDADTVHAVVGLGHLNGVLGRLEDYRDEELEEDPDFEPVEDRRAFRYMAAASAVASIGTVGSVAAGQPEWAAVFGPAAGWTAREAWEQR
ncbi:MAG: hypothetical protein SV186_02280 [Candidatus Nanohaloarchaea archaeon]|nr:hypothetical protein [Candidatus Nanohaloarchaea archaeon]